MQNMQKQCEKNLREKSNDEYSLSIRVQTTINHISICFYTTILTSKNFFFQNPGSVVWTLIDNGKLANQIARLTAIVVKIPFPSYFVPLFQNESSCQIFRMTDEFDLDD